MYPDAFIMNDCLFFGVFFVVHVLKGRDYMLKWEKSEAKQEALFRAQSENYYSTYSFLVKWHLFEIVVGKGLDWFMPGAITCSADGASWIYRTGKGHLFIMLHIMGTMMGVGLTRNVFIKTVKGGLEDEDEGDKKDN